MPFIGPRRRSYRPPPILDDGSSAVSHRRPILLAEAARETARRAYRARFRQPLLGLVLPDNGSSAISHRRPILVGLPAAQTNARRIADLRLRQPVIPPFPISDGTDARTPPTVMLAGIQTAGPQARRVADLRLRQPIIPPFPVSDGTDARTQPRPIVGLDAALVVAPARVRQSRRPVWLPEVRREAAVADTSRPFVSPLVGFPAATTAPLTVRARLRQPLIGLVQLADGTDARHLASTTGGLLVGVDEAHRARLAARARFRQAIQPPKILDDGSSRRTRPGALLGTAQAHLIAELRGRQWWLRLGIPRREPAAAIANTPGRMVSGVRLPQRAVSGVRLADRTITGVTEV